MEEYRTRPLEKIIRDFIVGRQADLASAIVECQWRLDPDLQHRYGTSGQRKCLEDANYHLRFLSEAVGAGEPALFTEYVSWAKTMLSSRNVSMVDLRNNLEAMLQVLAERLPDEMRVIPTEFVKAGVRELLLSRDQPTFLDLRQPLARLAAAYLAALLSYERHTASQLVLQAVKDRIGIHEIYLNVFERCQYEIGRLWQQNVVSVAQEHYCTASTQLIMSQLYPFIFGANRKPKGTIVAACVSGELHEMGARMLCDLLEMEGWNTIYLGANMPTNGIVGVLQSTDSSILAISASMTFHIPAVRELIAALRSARPATRIIVGGYAFRIAPNLWRDVGADYWARDASEAISLVTRLEPNSRETRTAPE